MRYWTSRSWRSSLFAACVWLFCDKLTTLLDTGTCASGNQPFVVARECPEGTDTDGLLIGGSIFGMFFAGGLLAFRGRAPAGARGGGLLGFGALGAERVVAARLGRAAVAEHVGASP